MDNSRSTFQLVLALFLISYCLATYKFDVDSCESMIPNENNGEVQNQAHNGDHSHHRRNAELEDEDDHSKEHKLKVKEDKSPFQVVLENFEFRRNRQLKVSIVGPGEFNGFMLQARGKRGEPPVGRFEDIPANAIGMNCGSPDDTLVHKDTGGKGNLTFTWKSSANPPNAIVFMLTIVQNDSMWTHVHSTRLLLSPFPPSAEGCGETKSCYSQSTINDCPPEKCDYFITSEVVGKNEIEMIIGGIVKNESGYVGIGFTMDNSSLTNMDISACVKFMNNAKAVQYFVTEWNNESISADSTTFNQMATDIDGDSIWCQIRRSLKKIGSETTADLKQTLFQTIIVGHFNTTTELPILPLLQDSNFVSEAWNYNQTIKAMHVIDVHSSNVKLEATIAAMFTSMLIVLFLSHF